MRILYLILIGICLTYALSSQLTPAVIDSLELQLNTAQDDIEKVDLMNDLSIRYYRVSVKREQEYAFQALELSRDIGYKKGETVALKNIGIVQRTIGAPLDSILYYYNASLALAEEHEFIDIKIALYNNIGLSLGEHAQYHKALNYLLKCMDLDEEHMPITWKRSMILANVGNLYYQLKDYEKADNYYEKSYELGEENGFEHINLMHVDDRALAKYRMGEKENAQRIIIESLDLLRAEGDYESLYQSLLALIDIRIEEGLTRSAEHLAQSMLEELNHHNLPIYECKLFNRLAEIEIILGNSQEALTCSLKSLECAQSKTSNIILTDAYKQLYNAYQLAGNTLMMDSIHNKYVAAAEMEFSRQIDIAISEEEFKYENLLKQREIQLLKEKQKVSDRLLNVFILGIIGLLLLSATAIYSYIRRNKIAIDLSEKNKALVKAEHVLEEKNKMLEKYIDSNIQLTQFAHIASHDLKSPLRTVSSFVGLAKNSAKDRLTDKENEYMDMSLDATKDMFHLVEDLLSYSKVNALDLQLEKIDIKTLLDEALSHLTYSINETNAAVKVDCKNKYIHADKMKLRQVIENLLSNALKFMPKGVTPLIQIQCEERENDLLFKVSDNGIGIDEKFSSQVFEPFKQLNSKDDYSGTGLGLALCREIIEKHHGNIWIESEIGKGTDIFFTIKKDLKVDNAIDKELQSELNSASTT